MSFIKQRKISTITSATPNILDESYMGEVICNIAYDNDLYLGFPENNNGLWYRIININDYNLNLISATPGAASTPTIYTLTANTSKLFISNGTTWIYANYEESITNQNRYRDYVIRCLKFKQRKNNKIKIIA
jgi:hypothetical protein